MVTRQPTEWREPPPSIKTTCIAYNRSASSDRFGQYRFSVVQCYVRMWFWTRVIDLRECLEELWPNANETLLHGVDSIAIHNFVFPMVVSYAAQAEEDKARQLAKGVEFSRDAFTCYAEYLNGNVWLKKEYLECLEGRYPEESRLQLMSALHFLRAQLLLATFDAYHVNMGLSVYEGVFLFDCIIR